MIVLCNRYFGSIARCDCGAILGYQPNDVSRAQMIRCPVCTNLVRVLFDPTYEGVIENGSSNVPELPGQSAPNSNV